PAIKRIVTKATTETTLVETKETSVVNEPAVETVDSTDTDSAIESH
ncbi:TPA: preprotein translocase subunit YajC, partial [Streptococcus pyogenes]